MPELGSLGSVRGVLRNERPYRECENSAARQAQPEFRDLWASRAEKIAKIHSPRGRREHPIEAYRRGAGRRPQGPRGCAVIPRTAKSVAAQFHELRVSRVEP